MSSEQSTTSSTDVDRRQRPRTVTNTQIKYKLSGDNEYTTGTLIDLSQTGALIEIDRPLFVKTQLSLVVDTNDGPVELIVEIARIAETYNENQYIYGCIIIVIINFFNKRAQARVTGCGVN